MVNCHVQFLFFVVFNDESGYFVHITWITPKLMNFFNDYFLVGSSHGWWIFFYWHLDEVGFLFRVILLVWRSLTHTKTLMSTSLYFMSTVHTNYVRMLIRVLSIVLLIENNTTSHQILSWIDTNNILVWHIGLRRHDDPLLLREGLNLLIIDLIAVLAAFPIEATWELSMHHCGWCMQIIAKLVVIQVQRVQIRPILRLHKVVRLVVGTMVLLLLGVFGARRTW